MDSLLAAVNSFQPFQRKHTQSEFVKAATTYLATLEKLPPNVWEPAVFNADALFKSMDPRENSLGYCYVLHHLLHVSRGTIAAPTLCDALVPLLATFDVQQVRLVLSQFKDLLDLATDNTLFPAHVAIELIAHVIRRTEPNRAIFTSAHLTLAKLVYDAKLDDLARDILDADILLFPKPLRSGSAKPKGKSQQRLPLPTTLEHQQQHHHHRPESEEDTDAGVHPATLFDDVLPATVLEYHYVRALTFIQARDWARAQTALEQVIAHPTRDRAVSMFMTEAHKKWLLVGLLATGHAPSLPAHVAGHTKTVLALASAPYADVAGLFSTDNAAELKAKVDGNAAVWDADDNAPLAAAVLAAYQQWQIVKLRAVYHRVSVAQIRRDTLSAETAGPLPDDAAAAALVGRMIADGVLAGELEVGASGANSFLTFRDERSGLSEGDFAAEIARSHASVDALSAQFRVASQRLGTRPEYIRHLARSQKLQEREVDAGVGFDSTIEDEDLMTGVMSHM